jgi:putative ABC transport system substrate-binding protein
MLRRAIACLLLLVAGQAHADFVVLLSDAKPSLSGVAQAIQSMQTDKVEIFNLGGNHDQDAVIVTAIQNSKKRQVVAIGLPAAQLARQRLHGKQVVFCQVPNYEKFSLVTPWMKGVRAIPSLSRQFRAWKLLDPNLQRIGVVAGRNMQDVLREAQLAAKANGLELLHAEVALDREVLGALERMKGKVQGIWLAPDSSILSTRVIREAMSYSTRNGIQMLAFSPALLNEGALLAGTPNFNEVAHKVLMRLQQAQGADDIPGEPAVALSSADIRVNVGVADKLGLTLSDKFKEFINGE